MARVSSLWEPLQGPCQALLDAARNGSLTSARRSRSEQTRLYARFLSGRSQYPAAPPGSSLHELGLAFDMTADNLNELGALWQSWGGVWGGSVDPVHFQVRVR